MPSSLEIAQEAQLRPIAEIAEAAGLLPDEIEPYGRYKAKIDLGVRDRRRARGGYTQVVPMEDMNLHFTGDIHAIGAANNLLAAMLEAHILHGNTLRIDALSISWRRCLDINHR